MMTGPSWPAYSDEEIEAVTRILRSGRVNYWTGDEGRAFEAEFAAFAGTAHAIAVANGTVALDLALYGLGIGAVNGGSPEDEVIVTPRSFVASASAIVNAGARPVFADVDRDSQNITPETSAPLLGPRTRAILCVHLSGWPCDMDGFHDLVAGTGVRLIEDCAQAHGALYKGRPVGGLGDVAAWSFCQDKIISTGGEGGMVTCDDRDVWQRMWSMKDHGKSWEAVYEREHPPGFRWLHESFGTNWRLTEMQSAIGRIQLRRMPQTQAARAAAARTLTEILTPFSELEGPLRLPCYAGSNDHRAGTPASRHAWYRYYAFVHPESRRSRDEIVAAISGQGLPVMQGICPEIYLEAAFDGHPSRPADRLPAARELGETSLMFLTHPGVEPVKISL